MAVTHERIVSIYDYEQYIGSETIDRIVKKAQLLQDRHIVHVNATFYGGGVAELLGSLTLMMNTLGIKTGWRVIQGSPDFFNITKKIHNALQGGEVNWTSQKKEIFEHVVAQNAMRNHLDHDLVIIHDPQPIMMINHCKKKGPWIWVCHVDLSKPNTAIWKYLSPTIEKYDAAVVSLSEYRQNVQTPQLNIMPAIDPFTIHNREFSEGDVTERLEHYGIPTDLPLVVQVSRFDKWKDPKGVIEAFKIARERINATLVLLGNVATDDPEGPQVYESLLSSQEERIIIKSVQDSALVNALQRSAAVVLQKSLKEGFGLTVAEAMWKGTPVIGGNVGGIRAQITNGVNGYLVSSIQEAADRIVELARDRRLAERMGVQARNCVKERFLLSRYLEQYLDLFNSFETEYLVKYFPGMDFEKSNCSALPEPMVP